MKEKLFKITCLAKYNRNLSSREEYLRCKDKRTLTTALERAFINPNSEYFGYVTLDVVSVKDVPTLKMIKMKHED